MKSITKFKSKVRIYLYKVDSITPDKMKKGKSRPGYEHDILHQYGWGSLPQNKYWWLMATKRHHHNILHTRLLFPEILLGLYLYLYSLFFLWSGHRGSKAYSLWGGVIPSQSIDNDYL